TIRDANAIALPAHIERPGARPRRLRAPGPARLAAPGGAALRPSPPRRRAPPPGPFVRACGGPARRPPSDAARSVRGPRPDAATPDCQSPESTSATARGRALDSAGVKTAWATAAASAVGSAPPTRVVFFVANCGKPSC